MKFPIGIQDFESLRMDGYVYVDKTEQMYRLVSQGRYYFLSRPRRFGKSLLLSTLKAFFLGKRELFHGLAVDRKEDWDWAVHPVLYLDLNTERYDSKETLTDRLNLFLSRYEQTYGRNEAERSLGARFEGATQQKSPQRRINSPYPTTRLEAIRRITTISCRCYPKSFWNTSA